jgi:hypothetical protein
MFKFHRTLDITARFFIGILYIYRNVFLLKLLLFNCLNQVNIKNVINRFVQAGSVNKGKSTGRLAESVQAQTFCNI